MWMMGYNDHGGELNLHDSSFNGTSRRLRPLIPRPLTSNSNNNLTSSNSNLPYNFFSPYNHLGEQNKREFNSNNNNNNNNNNNITTPPQVVASSRWNPTPEQLRALEELYRRGTRTPSAEQIQHITAQLRRYGKIEGKNVFYWFQNHKARERQKRRRQMETAAAPPVLGDDLEILISDRNNNNNNNKELGSVFEVEQTKNWPPSSNCSTTLAEDSHVSRQRAVSENNNNNNNKVVAGSILSAMQGSECARTDGWFQLGEMELHNRRRNNNNNNNNIVERNATWQMMQLSCPNPLLLTHLINTPSSTSTTTNTSNNTSNIISTNTTKNIHNNNCSRKTMVDQNSLIKSTTRSSDSQNGIIISSRSNHLLNGCDEICPSDESQTLQLFPLRSGTDFLNDKGKMISGMNASTPSQFFEFLPLKN